MTGKNFKITAEIVNGICPTCDEYTPLVGITKQFFRCLTCGSDLEQKVNGKISYIPHLTSKSLMSDVEKYFEKDGYTKVYTLRSTSKTS